MDIGIKTINADNLLKTETDWVTGANKSDMHIRHVDLERDVRVSEYTDLVNINASDCCPECGEAIHFYKGIEVGHIFKLGSKYSRAMQARFVDEQGHEQDMIVGCYGIGGRPSGCRGHWTESRRERHHLPPFHLSL